jgi:hypothetical protein
MSKRKRRAHHFRTPSFGDIILPSEARGLESEKKEDGVEDDQRKSIKGTAYVELRIKRAERVFAGSYLMFKAKVDSCNFCFRL